MKRKIIAAAAAVWVVLLAAIGQARAAGPEIKEISHSVLSESAEEVRFQLNGPYSPKIFTLKDESPRVVIDFPGFTHGKGVRSLTKTDGALVKRIRVGMHTEKERKTRVVLDMTTLDTLTHEQRYDEASTSLFLTLRLTGAAPAPAPADEPQAEAAPAETTSAPKATKPAPARVKPSKAKTTETGAAAGSGAETAAQSEAPATAEPGPSVAAEEKAAPAPATTEEQPKPTAKEASAEQPKVAGGEKKKQPGPSTGPVLESVKFDGASSKGEMVLFKLNNFFPPSVHGIEEGAPKVICEFDGMQLADTVEKTIKAKGKYVRLIRVSKHRNPEKIKVVLELEPNRNYDLQQVFFKEDNLFVIIVNTVKR